MSKSETIIGILSIIALAGVILLLAFGKEIAILMPILTALVGWLLGSKKETVLGFLKKKE
jgi:hypothetical protein